jgi:16S rRNA processing protein RimM
VPRRPRPRRRAELPNQSNLPGVANLLDLSHRSGVPILLGVIGRAHGVRGLARVTSHTAEPADLTAYGPLSDATGRRFTLRWVGQGIAEIAEIIDGKPVKLTDRTAAERLTNTKLFIERNRLPPPEADEYYLADLIGLNATGVDGARIGMVSAVHDYGAGASLEIDLDNAGSMLIPFTLACVPEVNIAAGRVIIAPPDEIDVPETAAPEGLDAPATNMRDTGVLETASPMGAEDAGHHRSDEAARRRPEIGAQESYRRASLDDGHAETNA